MFAVLAHLVAAAPSTAAAAAQQPLCVDAVTGFPCDRRGSAALATVAVAMIVAALASIASMRIRRCILYCASSVKRRRPAGSPGSGECAHSGDATAAEADACRAEVGDAGEPGFQSKAFLILMGPHYERDIG